MEVTPIALLHLVLFLARLFTSVEGFKQIAEVQFSGEEFNEYVHHYSNHPLPSDRSINDNRTIFLLGKGAEILVKETGEIYQQNFVLRKIGSIGEVVINSTYKFVLFVENSQYRNISQLTVVAKLGYGPNVSSIHATVLSTGFVEPASRSCDQISQLSNCTQCTGLGRCEKGCVPIDPWLKYSLKTQRDIQVDKVFTKFQFLEAHNAFNNRADMYGVLDDCRWPPPYRQSWVCLANQEFSLTDLLDIGVHALELDPWWCFGQIRLSHAEKRAVGCAPVDRPYSEGIRELGDWVRQGHNRGKVIRIYLEDGLGHTKGHDELVNGPIREYLGPYLFSPSDLRETFSGAWPTIRQLQKMNKTVIFATDGSYTHGGEFIHQSYWRESPVNKFTPYPDCGNLSVTRRFYSDSTNYGPIWNGPKATGVILDFAAFTKCRVEYPAADQVNTKMLRSAVYTWAEGEPSQKLTLDSCVYLSASDGRWYVSLNCSTQLYHACSRTNNTDVWVISREKGSSSGENMCPEGYTYDVPNDGYKKEKLLESMNGHDTWINVQLYLPLLINRSL